MLRFGTLVSRPAYPSALMWAHWQGNEDCQLDWCLQPFIYRCAIYAYGCLLRFIAVVRVRGQTLCKHNSSAFTLGCSNWPWTYFHSMSTNFSLPRSCLGLDPAADITGSEPEQCRFGRPTATEIFQGSLHAWSWLWISDGGKPPRNEKAQ